MIERIQILLLRQEDFCMPLLGYIRRLLLYRKSVQFPRLFQKQA